MRHVGLHATATSSIASSCHACGAGACHVDGAVVLSSLL